MLWSPSVRIFVGSGTRAWIVSPDVGFPWHLRGKSDAFYRCAFYRIFYRGFIAFLSHFYRIFIAFFIV
jgi:hypothetical protein